MLRKRYRRITSFFARIISSLIFWELVLPNIGFRKYSQRSRSNRLKRIAVSFRGLATDMGGLMIKVGQFLSTRVDVLPEEITIELANLQDEVTPEIFGDIQQVAEAEFGDSLEEFFKNFDRKPMAAASLGQVHRAFLYTPENGFTQVVVKVQRPDIEKIITIDLSALRTVGNWIKKYPPISKRANIPSLLDEFAKITFEEIDYLAEGKNAETFAANFSQRPGVRVPKVVWTHTTRRVLTLEDIQAIKITDYDAISSAGISRSEVAQRLFETYLKQIFEDGFFHADPHPGNLFVEPKPDRNSEESEDSSYVGWTLNFVDFGMVGRVPQNVRAGLREMAMGVGTQNSARLVKSYQMLGVLLPNADLKLIQSLDQKVFDQFWGKSMAELKEISWDEMHGFAKEFREIIYDMPFQFPENLIFLVRCIAILSGMCTGLNPDFNVWEGLSPFASKIIREESVQGWDFWRGEIVDWVTATVDLPRRLDVTLKMIERGEMAVDTPILNQQAARLEVTGRRLIFSIIFSVLFISGVQLYLAEELIFGIALLITSIIPLFRVIKMSRRN